MPPLILTLESSRVDETTSSLSDLFSCTLIEEAFHGKLLLTDKTRVQELILYFVNIICYLNTLDCMLETVFYFCFASTSETSLVTHGLLSDESVIDAFCNSLSTCWCIWKLLVRLLITLYFLV